MAAEDADATATVRALRTPDSAFADVPDFAYEPHYCDVGNGLRMAFVDEGPRDGPVVLMLHGEPSWSFLYRKVIKALLPLGYRCVAPDLIGLGRSDKPVEQSAYTYARHVRWLTACVVGHLDLRAVTLVCQDWGGLLGLRMAAAHPDRFARIVAANTGLPTGEFEMPAAFKAWQKYSRECETMPIGPIIQRATVSTLTDAEERAYDAPFPNEDYKSGAKIFPSLVPTEVDSPGAADNRAAWEVLSRYARPFMCAFSDQDPITRGADMLFTGMVPGADVDNDACRFKGKFAHPKLRGGGHFLQEDVGPELADAVHRLVQATPDAMDVPALQSKL